MKKLKIRSGDQVMVITGKDKGKKGKVLTTFVEDGMVLVQGINQYKKHVKATQKSPQGGIVDIDVKVNVSNVMLICPKCGEKARVGRKLVNNELVRTCHKCDKEIV